MNEFECRKCGQCCKVFKLDVNNKEELQQKFRDHFGFALKSSKIEAVFYGECEFLKDNQCTNYENRSDICKNYICKKFVKDKVPDGALYEKRCLVCQNIRQFQAGTERDRQSICGNCWVW